MHAEYNVVTFTNRVRNVHIGSLNTLVVQINIYIRSCFDRIQFSLNVVTPTKVMYDSWEKERVKWIHSRWAIIGFPCGWEIVCLFKNSFHFLGLLVEPCSLRSLLHIYVHVTQKYVSGTSFIVSIIVLHATLTNEFVRAWHFFSSACFAIFVFVHFDDAFLLWRFEAVGGRYLVTTPKG